MSNLLTQLQGELLATASDAGIALPDGWGDGPDSSVLASAQAAGVPAHRVLRALARALGVEVIEDLTTRTHASEFVRRVPIAYARRHHVLGLDPGGASATSGMPLAVSELTDLTALDVLTTCLGQALVPILADAQGVLAAINRAYQSPDALGTPVDGGAANDDAAGSDSSLSVASGVRSGRGFQDILATLDRDDAQRMVTDLEASEGQDDLLDVATRAPVIRLVSLMLFEAVRLGASDVHVQPHEDRLVVRMRVDGLLFDAFEVPKGLQEEVVSRIKVMGKMDIAEKRLPQDGRTTVRVGDRVIDLRIASLPASHGERVVLRLLDKSARLYTLDEVGMPSDVLRRFADMIQVEHGLVLVTGPTGSGKSTTLYAALQRINIRERNVLTLEDPIEYQLPGVSQTQVNPKKGLTFAMGLRNVLRQDPDIIMVGEVRDRETAVMAIQSALTGHLVFSTLHTNDAASAVTRLLDLGIEPYLAASSLVGVLAQRLVRKVCPHCAEPPKVASSQMASLGIDPSRDLSRMRLGRGCERCRHTGYRGRAGVFELLTLDDTLRGLIQSKADASEIKRAAVRAGMRTLRDDGLEKALAGVTTFDEVARVSATPEGLRVGLE